MEKQILNHDKAWELAEKLGEKYDVIPEEIMGAFLSCPPTEKVEDITDFSNNYLADFLCKIQWQDVEKMTRNLDWKRFDAIQWGKLTAYFGDKLDGKSDVVPCWGHKEWAYIISNVPANQLSATVRDCDKWDEFTAKDWAEVYSRCDEVDAKIETAVKNFTHQDWYDFLTNCEYPHDFIDDCQDYDQLVEEFPDLEEILN